MPADIYAVGAATIATATAGNLDADADADYDYDTAAAGTRAAAVNKVVVRRGRYTSKIKLIRRSRAPEICVPHRAARD